MEYMGIAITGFRITIRALKDSGNPCRSREEQVMVFPPTGYGELAFRSAIHALMSEAGLQIVTDDIDFKTGIEEAVFA